MADLVVVVAVTNREAKSAAHGISLFLVEGGMKGFQKGRKLDKIGLKAQVQELTGTTIKSFFRPSKGLMPGCSCCPLTTLPLYLQRTQLNCFLKMCDSQPVPSWAKSTKVSTT